MTNKKPTAKSIIDLVRASPAARVKALSPTSTACCGKYLHKINSCPRSTAGFGFCNVVFGWDMADQCYDNTTWTGWHTGLSGCARQDRPQHLSTRAVGR
jgi:glutamine synthetase